MMPSSSSTWTGRRSNLICPVLVVPGHDGTVPGLVHYRRIVCAVDLSASSLETVGYALSLGEESEAAVRLLHVLELPPELQAMSARGEDDQYQSGRVSGK